MEHTELKDLRLNVRRVCPQRKPERDETNDEQPCNHHAKSGHFHLADNKFAGSQRLDRHEVWKRKVSGPEIWFDETFADRECENKRQKYQPPQNVIRITRIRAVEPRDRRNDGEQDERDARRKQPATAPPLKPKL